LIGFAKGWIGFNKVLVTSVEFVLCSINVDVQGIQRILVLRYSPKR